MKPRRRRLLLALSAPLFALSLLSTGCTTPPRTEDNTARWIAHPEFRAAVRVAPHLMSDILTTTTRLEAEKAAAAARAK
jgi:hypothetical protein